MVRRQRRVADLHKRMVGPVGLEPTTYGPEPRARGTVVRVEGDSDKVMAHVEFGIDTGVKRLLLRYAPLTKL